MASVVRSASNQMLSSRPTRTPPPIAMATEFSGNCAAPIPARLQYESAGRSRIITPACIRSAWAQAMLREASNAGDHLGIDLSVIGRLARLVARVRMHHCDADVHRAMNILDDLCG